MRPLRPLGGSHLFPVAISQLSSVYVTSRALSGSQVLLNLNSYNAVHSSPKEVHMTPWFIKNSCTGWGSRKWHDPRSGSVTHCHWKNWGKSMCTSFGEECIFGHKKWCVSPSPYGFAFNFAPSHRLIWMWHGSFTSHTVEIQLRWFWYYGSFINFVEWVLPNIFVTSKMTAPLEQNIMEMPLDLNHDTSTCQIRAIWGQGK